MISRLTRMLLALVTAFVFTGQMEAAAQHCAKLAEAAAIVAVAERAEPPCHETQSADVHVAMGHAPSSDIANTHSDHAKSPPHCECIAALTGWVDLAGAATSTHAEAYVWLSPVETTFASAKPDPDLRPPRA